MLLIVGGNALAQGPLVDRRIRHLVGLFALAAANENNVFVVLRHCHRLDVLSDATFAARVAGRPRVTGGDAATFRFGTAQVLSCLLLSIRLLRDLFWIT